MNDSTPLLSVGESAAVCVEGRRPSFYARLLGWVKRIWTKNNRNPTYWPELHTEIGPDCLKYLTGEILNAGAGDRLLQPYVNGVVTNQDIPCGIHNHNIHIYSPLTAIPRPDGAFDSIVCNAVLEHVDDPAGVVKELARVLKPGGYLYLAVPFLQPEHLDPTDYQRYTRDGLCLMVERHGFKIVKVEPIGSMWHTLSWIVHEWLTSRTRFAYWLLRQLIYPILRYKTKRSRHTVHSIATAYRVVAQRTSN